jgi:hypothetical protein
MSGVKWDRNLGKKCKSGVSIRKRKAELEWKNLELSGSPLNFFKWNDDASVTDFGENESGELVEGLYKLDESIIER